jgi:hypothetical protein
MECQIYTKCKVQTQKKATKKGHQEPKKAMKKTMYPQTPPPNIAKTTQPLNLAGLKANILRRYK